MSAYSNEAPFEASILVHFRERIGVNLVNQVNKRMVINPGGTTGLTDGEKKPEGEEKGEEESEPKNQGQLILDATCAPADIRYPNDLGILNQAREQTEEIIDSLYEPIKDQFKKKLRTYREKARKAYLEVAKRRSPSQKQRRKAIKKQLQYIKRNLAHIERLMAVGASLSWLSKRQYKMLLIVTEVYRQQLEMWSNKKMNLET